MYLPVWHFNICDIQQLGFMPSILWHSLRNFNTTLCLTFSAKARPLNDLTKKDILWRWENDEETAFTTLKQAFAETPVLALYDPNRLTKVEVDASNFATSRVLSQKGNDGLWHLIAYWSEMMNAPECNYEIYDEEFMAIIQALKD